MAFLMSMACTDQQFKQGERLYVHHCASCHMDDGSGLKKIYPSLQNADFLKKNRETLACQIREGIKGNIQVNGVEYSGEMPGISILNDVELANIINYIHVAWNPDLPLFTIQEVKAQLEKCDPYAK